MVIIRFSPIKQFTSLKTLMNKRNPETDIDITNDKFQYKEIEKILSIKEKKQVTTDFYIEEIYYINGKLVILKGILNGTELIGTPINLQSNISIFENTTPSIITSS